MTSTGPAVGVGGRSSSGSGRVAGATQSRPTYHWRAVRPDRYLPGGAVTMVADAFLRDIDKG